MKKIGILALFISGMALNSHASTINMASKSINFEPHVVKCENKIDVLVDGTEANCKITYSIRSSDGSTSKGVIIKPTCKEAAETIIKIASVM